MWGYDGQTFTTVDQFTAYLQQKFGNSYLLNLTSINNWGEDLLGNQVYYNGIAQTGSLGAQYAADGFQEAQAVMDAYTANPAQVSADTIAQLNKLKQAQEVTIQGSTYTNGAVQLGTSEAQGGQVLVATTPVVSNNGTPFNAPKVMTEEAVEDPTVPGTFSYLATLKALGWLPLPTWTTAVAPLLGVGLGAALYSLNPEFWEKVSRTLLPFCYDDNGTAKMPISVDENGNVHTPESAIEALRNLLIEEGAYQTKPIAPTGTFTVYGENVSDTIIDSWSLGTFYKFPATYYQPNSDLPVILERLSIEIGNDFIEIPTDKITCVNVLNGAVRDIFFFADVSDYYDQLGDTARFNVGGMYKGKPDKFIMSGTIRISKNATVVHNGETRQLRAWLSTSYGGYKQATAPYPFVNITTKYLPECSLTFGESGGGIEGVIPESSAVYPTDTTKNLAEIYPTWAGNAINVVNNPTGTTIEDSTEKWYPLSLSNTNYSTDTANTSSTQTQTDAQSGTNTDSSQLNQIAQALQELTQTLTENGVLPPNPTIPSYPSGDTPTPTPPVITGAGSDLIAIYNPTKTQLQQFNQFLWSLDPTNLTNWKKVFANPIDAIIALQMIYVTPITGESRNIKCGYIETDVSSSKASLRFLSFRTKGEGIK